MKALRELNYPGCASNQSLQIITHSLGNVSNYYLGGLIFFCFYLCSVCICRVPLTRPVPIYSRGLNAVPVLKDFWVTPRWALEQILLRTSNRLKQFLTVDVLFWDSVSSTKDSELQPTNLLKSSILTCIDQTCYCICTFGKISACFFFPYF